jgi:hypothetical protein
MREIRQSGSEGGGTEVNRFSLPLLKLRHLFCDVQYSQGGYVRFSMASAAARTPFSAAIRFPALAALAA